MKAEGSARQCHTIATCHDVLASQLDGTRQQAEKLQSIAQLRLERPMCKSLLLTERHTMTDKSTSTETDRKLISRDRGQRIISLHQQGQSVREIAALPEPKCSISTVQKTINAYYRLNPDKTRPPKYRADHGQRIRASAAAAGNQPGRDKISDAERLVADNVDQILNYRVKQKQSLARTADMCGCSITEVRNVEAAYYRTYPDRQPLRPGRTPRIIPRADDPA